MYKTESFEAPHVPDISEGVITAKSPLLALEKVIGSYNHRAPMKSAKISSLKGAALVKYSSPFNETLPEIGGRQRGLSYDDKQFILNGKPVDMRKGICRLL